MGLFSALIITIGLQFYERFNLLEIEETIFPLTNTPSNVYGLYIVLPFLCTLLMDISGILTVFLVNICLVISRALETISHQFWIHNDFYLFLQSWIFNFRFLSENKKIVKNALSSINFQIIIGRKIGR